MEYDKKAYFILHLLCLGFVTKVFQSNFLNRVYSDTITNIQFRNKVTDTQQLILGYKFFRVQTFGHNDLDAY